MSQIFNAISHPLLFGDGIALKANKCAQRFPQRQQIKQMIAYSGSCSRWFFPFLVVQIVVAVIEVES